MIDCLWLSKWFSPQVVCWYHSCTFYYALKDQRICFQTIGGSSSPYLCAMVSVIVFVNRSDKLFIPTIFLLSVWPWRSLLPNLVYGLHWCYWNCSQAFEESNRVIHYMDYISVTCLKLSCIITNYKSYSFWTIEHY